MRNLNLKHKLAIFFTLIISISSILLAQEVNNESKEIQKKLFKAIDDASLSQVKEILEKKPEFVYATNEKGKTIQQIVNAEIDWLNELLEVPSSDFSSNQAHFFRRGDCLRIKEYINEKMNK